MEKLNQQLAYISLGYLYLEKDPQLIQQVLYYSGLHYYNLFPYNDFIYDNLTLVFLNSIEKYFMIDSTSPIILQPEQPSYIEELLLEPQNQIDISIIEPLAQQKKVTLINGQQLLQNQPFYVLFNFEQIIDSKTYQLYVSSYRIILNCLMAQKIISIPHGYIKQMFCYEKQVRFILKTGLKVFIFPEEEQSTNQIFFNIVKGRSLIPFCLQLRFAEDQPVIYDCLAQMQRMRINWKKCLVLKNSSGQFCPTYPKNIFLPAKASQQLVQQCKNGRVGNRIPVLSYYYSPSSVSLWRGSHTIKDHNTKYDYSYLQLISQKLLIIQIQETDNRKQSYHGFNHFNNFIKFKPYKFETLHNVKLNYEKLALNYLKCSKISQMCLALQKWYQDIDILISCSFKAANYLKEGRHVFVQQNDPAGKTIQSNNISKGGVDRACQISALTSIIMDPFYRTFNGLSVLIQKQFISFGYPFFQRTSQETEQKKQVQINLSISISSYPQKQKFKYFSPTFIQFLQCVHQLINCFPENFQYSASYLAKIGYQLYACKFNNFLFNSIHQKQADKDIKQTTSLWRKFPKQKHFYNIHFKHSSKNFELINIRRCPSPKQYVIWRDYWDMVTSMECQKEQYCQVQQINQLRRYFKFNYKRRKIQCEVYKEEAYNKLKSQRNFTQKLLGAKNLQRSEIITLENKTQFQVSLIQLQKQK